MAQPRYRTIQKVTLKPKGTGNTSAITTHAVIHPVTNPPIATPVTNPTFPVTNPAVNLPVTNPAINPPVINPAINPPVTNPAVNPPVINPAVNPPVINPAVNPPVINPVINPPVINPAVNPPVINPAVNSPVINPAANPPVINPAVNPPAVTNPAVSSRPTRSRSVVEKYKASLKSRSTSATNPPSKADRVRRTDTNYRVTNGSIAAIDFGTTSVSLAFTATGDEKVSTLILDDEEKGARVPNAVLLKREGQNNVTVTAFGVTARKNFTAMRSKSGQNSDYIYFERIKMLMKREKSLDRQTLVESFSGEKFYLLEVIAFILKYLKDLLIDHLSRTVKRLKTTDFDWVITVPAIWDARGKRMMREAAYLAGLLTESGGITQFTPVSDRSLPPPQETNPDKLSLALEPESAAIYSQVTVLEQIKSAGSKALIQTPKDYLVIDIGGGTVDITAHSEVDGGIKIENVPTGNDWGGTRINEAFSDMLQKIVSDPNFESFIASGDYPQQMGIANNILYKEFESQKLLFGQGRIAEELTVNLAGKFAKYYDEALQVGVTKMKGVDYDDDSLFISKEVVETELFGPALDGIISCTLDAIRDNGCKADTFYLVGGFGGCKYVHEKVKAAINELYQSKGLTCDVVVPPTPHLAIATGAAQWRKEPEKVKARRVDATYGIGTGAEFDPEKHDEHYRYYSEDWEQYRCGYLFNIFLEKGELASAEEVIATELIPNSEDQISMSIKIYTTPKTGVYYIVDKNDEATVMEIGQLVIDIPNPNRLPREKRRVDVTMDFSGTEIQAKAKYRVTGEEVKTVCDFLTAKE